jgi:hypothetical protein
MRSQLRWRFHSEAERSQGSSAEKSTGRVHITRNDVYREVRGMTLMRNCKAAVDQQNNWGKRTITSEAVSWSPEDTAKDRKLLCTLPPTTQSKPRLTSVRLKGVRLAAQFLVAASTATL